MIAETILREYNLGNRPKKPKKIAEFAADMAAQRWALTGESIKFSHRLRDGQNRLAACMRAGVSFATYVVFGIDDDAFDRMDQGRNRSGADVLAIAGFQNTAALSGAVRWANLIETGRAKQRDTYPPPEILRLLQERYGRLPDYLPQARAIYNRTRQPISLITALLYLFEKANPHKASLSFREGQSAQQASEFATAWETGNMAPKFKTLTLMQRAISELQGMSSGRVHDVVRAAVIIKAWNLFVTGQKGNKTMLQWIVGQDFPEINFLSKSSPATAG
jgi:hypothetical protein